jgi:hypothetical protein
MVAAPEYSLHVQAMFVPAMGALHSFIRIYDPDDMDDDVSNEVERRSPPVQPGDLGGNISRAEQTRASTRRDEIAKAMWAQYVEYQRQAEGQGE